MSGCTTGLTVAACSSEGTGGAVPVRVRQSARDGLRFGERITVTGERTMPEAI
jgi:hypothetical protein